MISTVAKTGQGRRGNREGLETHRSPSPAISSLQASAAVRRDRSSSAATSCRLLLIRLPLARLGDYPDVAKYLDGEIERA
jgi:hypothetical protein